MTMTIDSANAGIGVGWVTYSILTDV
jgi:hypothetical protein